MEFMAWIGNYMMSNSIPILYVKVIIYICPNISAG